MYETERKMGFFTMALAVAGGLVIGGIVLSAALWLLGMLAGVVVFVIKIALLVALAAGVVWAAKFFFGDRDRHVMG